MAEKVLINDKAVPVNNTKVQFGALNAPTPQFATWIFRAVFICTTVASFYIAGTSLLSAGAKTEVLLALKTADALVLGLSKMFGIVVDEAKE